MDTELDNMQILNGAPVLDIVLENPFLLKKFPVNGTILAVFDTGYEGFALIPEDIFKELDLDELSSHDRDLILPDGSKIQSKGVFGKVGIPEIGISRDGLIETAKGIEEVVLGTNFAEGLKFILDYCLYMFKLELC